MPIHEASDTTGHYYKKHAMSVACLKLLLVPHNFLSHSLKINEKEIIGFYRLYEKQIL